MEHYSPVTEYFPLEFSLIISASSAQTVVFLLNPEVKSDSFSRYNSNNKYTAASGQINPLVVEQSLSSESKFLDDADG